MFKFLCVLMLMVGCTEPVLPNAPEVMVVFPDGSVELADQELVLSRTTAMWGELGFKRVDHTNFEECQRFWFNDGSPDCVITINVISAIYRDHNGHRAAGWANADSRVVGIDVAQHGYNFWAISVHEFGHILLDAKHLADDVDGVMNPWSGKTTPTQADYDLACGEIGICI